MKIASFLVAFAVLSGTAHAQVSSVTPERRSPGIFSPSNLSATAERLQTGNQVAAQREPGLTREKITRPHVLVGLGLLATGAIMAASASESATFTTVNPVTNQPLTSTVSATNNGQRWAGIGLLGAGGAMTYLGLTH